LTPIQQSGVGAYAEQNRGDEGSERRVIGKGRRRTWEEKKDREGNEKDRGEKMGWHFTSFSLTRPFR
jgi:hypothetical protein